MRRLYALVLALVLPAAHGAEVPGRVDWARVVDVGTPVSGRVVRVPAEVGERVDAGQILVDLDPRPFQIAVTRARVQVAGAEPRRAEAERERDRAEELYDQTLLSDHERELARIEFAAADAAYQVARADLERARLDLEYATVRAPTPGLILERLVEPGETVVNGVQGQVLVRLATLDRLRVRAPVDAAQAVTVRPGSEVRVTADGARYSARVVGVAPAGDGRYVVAADFVADDALALWGRPVQVELP